MTDDDALGAALDKVFAVLREHLTECPACGRRIVLDEGPRWCRNCGWEAE